MAKVAIEVHPVGPARWKDVEALFGPSGAYSGCWCMWWRVPGKEFGTNGNAGNKAAFRSIVRRGEPVGLLAYEDREPVGWMALAPREAYPRVARSPALKPRAEEAGVWAVTCFFIHRAHRRQGVAAALLDAAAAYAGERGASIVEGYPADTEQAKAAELFTGTVSMFARAGFTVHERPATGRRVIMRRAVQPPPSRRNRLSDR
jgi:GNAT superfamily N-acetyltransferase